MLVFSPVKSLSSKLFFMPFIVAFYAEVNSLWTYGIMFLSVSSMCIHGLETSSHVLYYVILHIDYYIIFFLNLIQIGNIYVFIGSHVLLLINHDMTRKTIFAISYINTFVKTITYKPHLTLLLFPSIYSLKTYYNVIQRGYFLEFERFVWHLGIALFLLGATFTINI